MTAKPLRERYLELIDRLIEMTLQGKIRSPAQISRMLAKEIESGTGEIFERCLAQRQETISAQLETKLKATRMLRALETISKEWLKQQQENQDTTEIVKVANQLTAVASEAYFVTVVAAIDPNQDKPLGREQLAKLAQTIKVAADKQEDKQIAHNWQQLATGIDRGLTAILAIETDLVSWIYDGASRFGGFGAEAPNPWRVWSQKLAPSLPQQLCQTLANNQPVSQAINGSRFTVSSWIELAILLQYVQRGLVTWFDKQPYSAKFGKQMSYSTFLSLAIIWCELWKSISTPDFNQGCFAMMLQILRSFAGREDFPLYSGVFASFSGEYLQSTLEYFDEPLKQLPGTQEKARILTLLGYSQRTLGRYDRAITFHQQALDIAREAADKLCEIANFNHLSRNCVELKKYDEAISYSQRGLILARQGGDRRGQANALVNLGYSKVLAARQQDTLAEDIYLEAISYLEQGVQLATQQDDLTSQSFGYSSLGIAYVIAAEPEKAIVALTKGAELAQYSRNIYLQGLSFAYLAEAYYSMEDRPAALIYGCLGMYLLKQIDSPEWRKPAGLMTILQGQLGATAFNDLLATKKKQIISFIGVDGYDYLPLLIEEYKKS